MAARTGMSTLISTWRRLVDDKGTAVWTDDEAQEILDMHRIDFWAELLVSVPKIMPGGSINDLAYLCNYKNLEGTASGSSAWRLYDAVGANASNYTMDPYTGLVTFTVNQAGSARYLDGRSFSMNAAAAQAWRERMAKTSSRYHVSSDGQSLARNQWFDHCMKMAEHYASLSEPVIVEFERTDLA